jgi:hypothetical protein
VEALRFIAEPVNHRLAIDLPPGLENKRLEVIVLPASEQESAPTPTTHHRPNARLRGTVSIRDDLIERAFTEKEWDALS